MNDKGSKGKGGNRHWNRLRRQAEERLKDLVTLAPGQEDVDLSSLFHELQVHQIELEMQNENLRQMQVLLSESRQKYLDLYDFAPVGYLTLDRRGNILEANLTASAFLGVERASLIGRRFPFLLIPSSRQAFGDHLALVFAHRDRRRLEVVLESAGAHCIVMLDSQYAQEEENVGHCRVCLTEIPELQRAQESLREKAAIVDQAHDAIIVRDLQGRITFWNPGAEALYGWSALQALGRVSYRLLQTKFPVPLADIEHRVLEQGYWEGEVQHVRADGTPIIVASRWSRQRGHGEAAAILEINRDVTERKQAELGLKDSERRLRHLTAQLLHAQEAERQRISRDLHDDLGQSLMALKMQLNAVKRQWRKGVEAWEEFDQAIAYIDQINDRVRQITQDLKPLAIENLGLNAALQQLLEDFQKFSKVQIFLEMGDLSGLFDPETEITIYRIFQECLTNIAKHSGATRLAIRVKKLNGSVSFVLEDNGTGLNSTPGPGRPGTGLAAMEERVRMRQGSFGITSEQGKGTRIAFLLPVVKNLDPVFPAP